MSNEKFNGYGLIDEVTKLFKLVFDEADYTIEGLLYPTDSVFSYGRPALYVYAHTNGGPSGETAFFACIKSIDDAGVSIFGPVEELEKARTRVKKFANFLLQLQYACPTKTQLREFCKNNGLQEDYW